MQYITLTKGKCAIVDDEDYDYLNQYKWCAQFTSQHRVQAGRRVGKSKISMHRFLMNPSPKMVIDHINGNPLDNRRANLRICTQAQNLANSRPYSKCEFKGVRKEWGKLAKPWRATIKLNGKNISIGYFATAEAAARAYDKAAKESFGEFAYLNFKD